MRPCPLPQTCQFEQSAHNLVESQTSVTNASSRLPAKSWSAARALPDIVRIQDILSALKLKPLARTSCPRAGPSLPILNKDKHTPCCRRHFHSFGWGLPHAKLRPWQGKHAQKNAHKAAVYTSLTQVSSVEAFTSSSRLSLFHRTQHGQTAGMMLSILFWYTPKCCSQSRKQIRQSCDCHRSRVRVG